MSVLQKKTPAMEWALAVIGEAVERGEDAGAGEERGEAVHELGGCWQEAVRTHRGRVRRGTEVRSSVTRLPGLSEHRRQARVKFLAENLYTSNIATLHYSGHPGTDKNDAPAPRAGQCGAAAAPQPG